MNQKIGKRDGDGGPRPVAHAGAAEQLLRAAGPGEQAGAAAQHRLAGLRPQGLREADPRDQGAGHQHADARVRELQQVHQRHGHDPQDEEQCGEHGGRSGSCGEEHGHHHGQEREHQCGAGAASLQGGEAHWRAPAAEEIRVYLRAASETQHTIQMEAEKIMQQLERLLKKRMLDPTLGSEEAQSSSDSVLAFLQKFNDEVLTKMGRVFSVYKTHFMPDIVAREKSSTSRKSSDAVRDDLFLSFVKELFALYLSECVVQFRRPHTDFGATEEILEVLQDDDLSADTVNSEYFVFMRVMKYFVSQVKQVDSTIPMCGLAVNATEIVESCVRFQIEGVFRKLREGTGELFVTSHEDVSGLARSSRDGGQSVQPLAHESAKTFTDMMQKVLQQMEPMVQTGFAILSEMSRLFSDLVQSQFYDFLKWFNTSVLQYAEPKRAFAQTDEPLRGEEQNNVALPWLEPTPQFLLFLACMCQDLSAEGIGECVRGLIECLPAPLSPSKTSGEPIRSHQMNQQDVTHMIEVTRETSAELLQHVVKLYGNQLCIIVHNGVSATSWADMDEEPRSVQEMMAAVVESTFRFGKELALALGDEQSVFIGNNSRTTSRDFRRRASALRSRNAGVTAASSGMQLDVDRIFARKIHIFPSQLELTADSFVQTMLKMCIKAFSEWVRLLELSKFGLQQIQLDAEFLRSTLMHIVVAGEAEEEVESLLSDLLSNARARAVEDVLMDQSNVVAIVSTKSTQVLSRRG
ncbi:hypothetical protein ON010_g4838 [Phytophthora cinnamomi]|nr:hypothetical protein ON010_g4838 [Phytophthora cinnamomi]